MHMISSTTHKIYKHGLKPILFKQKPDQVHDRLIKSGSVLQKTRIVPAVVSAMWAYNNEPKLSQDILDIHFSNPVGLSAGFDKNFELVPMLKASGFGFMEGGSITIRPCEGNARPWFYRLPKSKSLVVYAGLANQGASVVLSRLENYRISTLRNFPINISVAKTNSKKSASEAEAINDYIGSLKIIKKRDLGQIVTLNISCPNTYGGEPFTTPEKLERLLTAVDSLNISKPIFIKMPSNIRWKDFKALLKVADAHQISGVTFCNLAKDRSKLTLHDPLPDDIKGNLSGKPTWKLSNQLIRQTYLLYGDRFTIIGVGGIFSAEDAYTKIRLGASLVELITGMIFEGPQLIGQINRGLAELLKRDGYDNISEAIGVDSLQATSPR